MYNFFMWRPKKIIFNKNQSGKWYFWRPLKTPSLYFLTMRGGCFFLHFQLLWMALNPTWCDPILNLRGKSNLYLTYNLTLSKHQKQKKNTHPFILNFSKKGVQGGGWGDLVLDKQKTGHRQNQFPTWNHCKTQYPPFLLLRLT